MMPDVRYVCLSDMHLGANNSLLTNLKDDSDDVSPRHASPVMKELVACLRSLIEKNEGAKKPTLVLNGDILELALANDNHAAMVFEVFINLVMPTDSEPLFEEIIYIPGNHDHHLWETARETQYVNYIKTNPSQNKPGSNLHIPWHTTKMFCEDKDLVPSLFLTGIISRFPHLEDKVVKTAYPNYGLKNQDGDKCVVFSHGHFTEEMYTAMSRLRCKVIPGKSLPTQIWDIEAENFAWIDFFWSTMGRSGDVGKDVELIYNQLQDEERVQRLLTPLIIEVLMKMGLPARIDEFIANHFLGRRLSRMVSMERHEPEELLTEEFKKSLCSYVAGPVREQIKSECGQDIPADITFVFGHTHKPFEQELHFEGMPSRWVKVYNSGGWVIDSKTPQKYYGGAVVLVDENLDTAILRMYNEHKRVEDYIVRAGYATHENARTGPNPFYERVRDILQAEDSWGHFSEVVAPEVERRLQLMRTE